MPIVKFKILESTCVPLPAENIDTDQIIPARFLKATSREGCSGIGGMIRIINLSLTLYSTIQNTPDRLF